LPAAAPRKRPASLETRKSFLVLFSKKNIKNKGFFLKKEAKTCLFFRYVAWRAGVADDTQGVLVK